MNDLLASIDHKLDLVFYCLAGFLVLTAVRSYFQIRAYIKSKWRDAERDYYVELFRDQKYKQIISDADDKLAEDPKDLYATWYKAKALYTLERYDEAADLFDRVQAIEPDWAEYAQGYIKRINRRGEGEPTQP